MYLCPVAAFIHIFYTSDIYILPVQILVTGQLYFQTSEHVDLCPDEAVSKV